MDVNKYIQDAKVNLPTAGDDGQKKVLTGEEELDQLIGLDSVKRMVKKIKAYAKRNKGEAGFNLHMCFYGNPGTGKTEVARILSRILYDAGVLAEAKLVETDGHGLLGKFVGETAPKTEAKIDSAMGGVLFIDEAYALVGSHTATGGATNYGEEAIAVLLKEMEDRRGQFCAILAGYNLNKLNNIIKIVQRFTNTHKHNVAYSFARILFGCIKLRKYLACCKVAYFASLCGCTELAAHAASHLAGNTDAVAVFVTH